MFHLITAYRKESYKPLTGKRMQALHSQTGRVKDLQSEYIFSIGYLSPSLLKKSCLATENHQQSRGERAFSSLS